MPPRAGFPHLRAKSRIGCTHQMIHVDEAIARVLRNAPGPVHGSLETVSFLEAVGRVLARDVESPGDLPPFSRSTVDGFAVLGPVAIGERLEVVGESAAGRPFQGILEPAKAVRIFTGAKLPAVATTESDLGVIMVEDTTLDGDCVVLRAAVRAGQNVSKQGEDRRKGDVALREGALLGAGHIALLASIGATSLPVRPRVRVAILPTGSELVAPAAEPKDGCIRESNSSMLAALVRLAGAEPVDLGIVVDDKAAITNAARRGLESDFLLLSGGSSVGDYDFTPEVLEELGVAVHFDRIALKPGKPTLFGTRDDRMIFGLPGNPISAFVTFHLFVRPAIVARAGGPRRAPPRFAARLAGSVKRAKERDMVLPATLSLERGEFVAKFTGWHGSGDVTCLIGADALVFVPRGERIAEAGSACEVTPLDSGALGAYSMGISS